MAILTQVQWQTVTGQIRDVLQFLGIQAYMEDFYLAGGTALALREGHRISIDLDFFSETDEILAGTRQTIVESLSGFNCQLRESVDGNLLVRLDDLSVGFFGYGYSMLEQSDTVEGVNVASIADIGLMKLDALITRGSRKDFYDLYVICHKIPLPDLLAMGRSKYPYARDFDLMATESLVLFDNADRDVQPDLLIDLPWPDVRSFFLAEAQKLGEHWLGKP